MWMIFEALLIVSLSWNTRSNIVVHALSPCSNKSTQPGCREAVAALSSQVEDAGSAGLPPETSRRKLVESSQGTTVSIVDPYTAEQVLVEALQDEAVETIELHTDVKLDAPLPPINRSLSIFGNCTGAPFTYIVEPVNNLELQTWMLKERESGADDAISVYDYASSGVYVHEESAADSVLRWEFPFERQCELVMEIPIEVNCSSCAAAVPYTVHSAEGTSQVLVDQRVSARWASLGSYTLNATSAVELDTTGINGTIAAGVAGARCGGFLLRINPSYAARSASSSSDNSPRGRYMYRGRLDDSFAWTPQGVDNEWYQVDLGSVYDLAGVVTQGYQVDSSRAQYVTLYSCDWSLDGDRWDAVDKGKRFTGNSDGTGAVQGLFVEVVWARYLRLRVVEYHNAPSLRLAVLVMTGAPAGVCRLVSSGDFRLVTVAEGGNVSLARLALANGTAYANGGGVYVGDGGRVELHSCAVVGNRAIRCRNVVRLGLQSGYIPDEQITASSTEPDCSTASARLSSTNSSVSTALAWCGSAADGDWLQVDLGLETQVHSISTQGSGRYNEWVVEYTLSYSADGVSWQSAYDGRIFPANDGPESVRTHLIIPELRARYVRLYPKSWNGRPALRMELSTCLLDGTEEYIEADNLTLVGNESSYLEMITGACHISADGMCVMSSNYPEVYNNDEECSFTVLAEGLLEVHRFDLESNYDFFYVGEQGYTGSTGPSSAYVQPGTQLQFISDSVYNYEGFYICINDVNSDWIRLSDGNATAGVVEVYTNQTWRSVCAAEWTIAHGDVGCRQLGLGRAAQVGSLPITNANGSVGANTSDPPTFGSSECSGSEDALPPCLHALTAEENCTEQATVVCEDLSPLYDYFSLVEGACTISAMGDCFSSPGYPGEYPESQQCTFRVNSYGSLLVDVFDLENGYDYLYINSQGYTGADGPNEDRVSTDTNITFVSDESISGSGFHICLDPFMDGSIGGGLYAGESAHVLISDSVVMGNHATQGAGISVLKSSEVASTRSLVVNNTGRGVAGGVYLGDYASLALSSSRIDANSASQWISTENPGWQFGGGGVYAARSSRVSLINSSLSFNFAESGGAIVTEGMLSLDEASAVVGNQAQVNGGGIFVSEGAFMLMNRSSFVALNGVEGYGGGVSLQNGTSLSLDGGSEIWSNLAQEGGGGLYGDSRNAVVVCGGSTMHSNAGGNGGGMLLLSASDVLLTNGSSLQGNAAVGYAFWEDETGFYYNGSSGFGGGLAIEGSSPSLVLEGGSSVSNNTALLHGGGLHIGQGGSLLVRGSAVNGNEALEGSGGGISLLVQTEVLLTGSEVAGNVASIDGGGIAASNQMGSKPNILTLEEATAVVMNIAKSGMGGGIYGSSMTVSLSSGVLVEGNMASGNGGGLAVGQNSNATLSSGTSVSNNYALEGCGGGVYLSNYSQLVIDDSTLMENAADSSQGGGVCMETGSTLTMQNHSVLIRNAAEVGGGIHANEATEVLLQSMSVIESNSALRGGGIFSSGDVVLKEASMLTMNVAATSGGGIHGIAVTLDNSQVERNTAGDSGGGIYAESLSILDSVVTDNKAGIGGGISAVSLVMQHSMLTNNSASQDGGGLVAEHASMQNTYVSRGVAEEMGGGMYVKGTLSSQNVSIFECTASEGGGLILETTSAELSDLKVDSCMAITGDGGGVGVRTGNTTLEGALLSDNTAFTKGGGMFSSREMTMKHSVVKNNQADDGGGLAGESGTILVENTTISANTALKNGGGIFSSLDGSHLHGYNGVVLTNNKATDFGGGVYGDDVMFTDSTLAYNTAEGNGGGLHGVDYLRLERCEVTANIASGSGGGMSTGSDSQTVLESVNVSGNSASQHGGGLFLYKNSGAKLQNCTLQGNTGKNSGGGAYVSSSSLLQLIDNTRVMNNTAYLEVRGVRCALGCWAPVGRAGEVLVGGGVFLGETEGELLTVLQSVDSSLTGNEALIYSGGWVADQLPGSLCVKAYLLTRKYLCVVVEPVPLVLSL
ncbi:hypothetical protein CYMTET_4989, partial [Cymbomonas tetramitiformis]